MAEVVTPTFHLVPQLRMSHFIASFNYFFVLHRVKKKTTATDYNHEIHPTLVYNKCLKIGWQPLFRSFSLFLLLLHFVVEIVLIYKSPQTRVELSSKKHKWAFSRKSTTLSRFYFSFSFSFSQSPSLSVSAEVNFPVQAFFKLRQLHISIAIPLFYEIRDHVSLLSKKNPRLFFHFLLFSPCIFN